MVCFNILSNYIKVFILLIQVRGKYTLDCKKSPVCSYNQKSSSKSIWCAVCSYNDTCVYNITNLFDLSRPNDRCYFLDQCAYAKQNGIECKNGRCQQGFGDAKCICEPDYYGRRCEKKVPPGAEGKLVNGVHVKFTWILSSMAIESLVLGSLSEGAGAIYTVRTEYGFYAQVKSQGISDPKGLCDVPKVNAADSEKVPIVQYPDNKCPYKYKLTMAFPYDRDNKNSFLRPPMNWITGYPTHINVTIRNQLGKNKYIVSYENSFLIFVATQADYLSGSCTTKIELDNCGKSVDTPTVFFRGSNIDIVSHLTIIDALNIVSNITYFPTDKLKTEWKMWNFGMDESHDEYNDKPHINIRGDMNKERTLSLKPFTLDFGMHKILLNTSNHNDTKDFCYNSKYGYIRVDAKPLVVKVDQGDELYVKKEDGARYTTTKTLDVNYPSTKEGQDHLDIVWTCHKVVNYDPKHPNNKTEWTCNIKPKHSKQWEPYIIPDSELEYGKQYQFTVSVSTHKYDHLDDNVRNTVSSRSVSTNLYVYPPVVPERIDIKCQENCGDKVIQKKMTILKIENNKEDNNKTYVWKYYKDGVEMHDLDNITIPADSSRILIIKPGSLEIGYNYTFVATSDSNSNVTTSVSLEPFRFTYNGTCGIEPREGTRGYTLFNCECTAGRGYQYEFYDKYTDEIDNDVMYNGRMLGSTNSPVLRDFRLTRGNLIVYIVNEDGEWVSKAITVELFDWNVTRENITDIKQNITHLVEVTGNDQTLRYVSVVPDIIPLHKLEVRQDMLTFLLDAFCSVSMANMALSRLGISTLRNVVTSMNKERDLYLVTAKMRNTLRCLHNATKEFDERVRKFYIDTNTARSMSDDTVRHVAIYVLDCIYSTILLNTTETRKVDEDFIKFDILLDLRLCSKYAVSIWDSITDILSYLQPPGAPASKVTSIEACYNGWAMVNDDNNRVDRFVNTNKDMKVGIVADLMNELVARARVANFLTLQLLISNQNIFWWSRGFVKSNLISIKFAAKYEPGKLKVIKNFGFYFDIYMNLEQVDTVSFTNTIKQRDRGISSEDLDFEVVVHRFYPVRGSFTQIKFLFPSSEFSLRIVMTKNYRPDYTMVANKGILINKHSDINNLQTIETYTYDKNTFFYLGILPGNEKYQNENITYTFEINTTRCQTWNLGRWEGRGCKFGLDSDNHTVHCLCKHTSIFSVGFPITPHELNPFNEFRLILTKIKNYTLIQTILLLLVLYSIACIWAAYKDSKDKHLRVITILQDNFPCDQNPFLVSVWTGGRYNAGTTAHVAIKLYGEISHSRIHILSNENRNVLKRNTDEWFIILCPKPLGTLIGLQLFHDNYGSSPSWYCEKVCVYDLKGKVETVFLIEEWVALWVNEYPEVQVLPARMQDIMSIKRRFVDNIRFGVQETHILTSILMRNARSYITRFERVNILMCCIMIALLCSVTYYRIKYYPGIDEVEYKLSKLELMLSVALLTIIFCIESLIMLAFRKSIKLTYSRHTSTLNIRSASAVDYFIPRTVKADSFVFQSVATESITVKRRKERSICENCLRAVFAMTRQQPKMPVHLSYVPGRISRKKALYYLAWLICIFLIIGSIVLIPLLSIDLGDIQSQKSLTIAALAIAEEILILGPLKILLLSLLFSFAVKRLTETSAYDVKISDLKYYRRLYNKKDFYNKLIEIRSQPMYCPFRQEVRAKMARKVLRLYNWVTVIDFTTSVLHSVAVSYVILITWSSMFHLNQHIKLLATLGHNKIGAIDFYDISKPEDMRIYLENAFVRAFYSLRWYNDRLFALDNLNLSVDQYYKTSDCALKMLGSPLVRQLRVEPTECKYIIDPNQQCIPSYVYGEEDENTYSPGWMPAHWSDVSRNSSPWKFTERPIGWLFSFLRCYGASGKQLNYGGYMASLGTTRMQCMFTMVDLEENSWLNVLTRVVVVELTVYSINTNSFSQLTMFVEYSVTGTVYHRVQDHSLSGDIFTPWHITLLLFTVFFSVRTFKGINRHGFLKYLSFSNIAQIVIIVLGVVILTLLVLHHKTSDWYLEHFKSVGKQSYFDFDAFVYYQRTANILTAILMIVSIIRVLCLLRGGKFITYCFYTFILNLNNVLLLSSLAVLLMIVQSQFVAFVINILLYSSFGQAFVRHFDNVNSLRPEHSQHLLFIVITTFTIKGIMFLLVVLFTHYITVARTKKASDFNFIKFLIEELLQVKRNRNKD